MSVRPEWEIRGPQVEHQAYPELEAYPQERATGYYTYVNPIYPGGNVPGAAVAHIGDPLMPAESTRVNSRGRCRSIVLVLFAAAEIIMVFVTIFKFRWFEYCYWDFYLLSVTKNTSKEIPKGNKDHRISDFYSVMCDDDKEYIPQCPDLCSTLKPLQYSWKYFIAGCSLTTFLMALLGIYFIIKAIRTNIKSYKIWVIVGSLLSLAFFVAGFLIYFFVSGFDEHFDKVYKNRIGFEEVDEPFEKKKKKWPEPSEFHWHTGLYFFMITVGVMLILKALKLCLIQKQR